MQNEANVAEMTLYLLDVRIGAIPFSFWPGRRIESANALARSVLAPRHMPAAPNPCARGGKGRGVRLPGPE
jgi:hypothetical protein